MRIGDGLMPPARVGSSREATKVDEICLEGFACTCVRIGSSDDDGEEAAKFTVCFHYSTFRSGYCIFFPFQFQSQLSSFTFVSSSARRCPTLRQRRLHIGLFRPS